MKTREVRHKQKLRNEEQRKVLLQNMHGTTHIKLIITTLETTKKVKQNTYGLLSLFNHPHIISCCCLTTSIRH